MAIGASVGGLLADRIGRRSVFALTLLIYGLATGASALAMGVGALDRAALHRGSGPRRRAAGAASTLMSELARPGSAAEWSSCSRALWALGWILAAVIGTFVAASGPTGWRWALAVGLVRPCIRW